MESIDSGKKLAEGRLAVLSGHLSSDLSSCGFQPIIENSCVSAQNMVPPPGDLSGALMIIDPRTGKKYQVQISKEGTVKATDLKKVVSFVLFLFLSVYLSILIRRSLCFLIQVVVARNFVLM